MKKIRYLAACLFLCLSCMLPVSAAGKGAYVKALSDKGPLSGAGVSVYYLGKENYTPEFADLTAVFGQMDGASVKTVDAYIKDRSPAVLQYGTLDEDGVLFLEVSSPGMYFIKAGAVTKYGGVYQIEPSLCYLGDDGCVVELKHTVEAVVTDKPSNTGTPSGKPKDPVPVDTPKTPGSKVPDGTVAITDDPVPTSDLLPQTGADVTRIGILFGCGAGFLLLGIFLRKLKQALFFALLLAGFLCFGGGGVLLHSEENMDRDAGFSAGPVTDALQEYKGMVQSYERSRQVLHPDEEADVRMEAVFYDGVPYVGQLYFPALDRTLPVASELTMPQLKVSPARYAGNLQEGTLVVGAHSYKSHFRFLRDVKEGDEAVFILPDGEEIKYEVKKRETLKPEEVDAMCNGDWDMTLFTCERGSKTRVAVRYQRKEV